MKVGTDGILLGAWARGGKRILDVGTGTGLIALFMSQRFKNANITAIEIEHEAFLEAKENFLSSSFSDRITIKETSLQDFIDGEYDAIVCNPPFFNNSLKSPEQTRTIARHAETLTYPDLILSVKRLLSYDGEFSVIIPSLEFKSFSFEALKNQLFLHRQYAVKTMPYKDVSRYLLSFKKHPTSSLEKMTTCLMDTEKIRSTWFKGLTKDFYL